MTNRFEDAELLAGKMKGPQDKNHKKHTPRSQKRHSALRASGRNQPSKYIAIVPETLIPDSQIQNPKRLNSSCLVLILCHSSNRKLIQISSIGIYPHFTDRNTELIKVQESAQISKLGTGAARIQTQV